MIQRENIEAICRLSGVQAGLLFHCIHSPQARFYLTQHLVSLKGDLNADLFEESWRRTIQRHQALRASFHWQETDVPLQIFVKRVELPFERLDWRSLTIDDREVKLRSYLKADAVRGFDIARAPLMRLALFRLSDREWRLSWSNHHLILDGWSAAIIASDAFRTYEALLNSRAPDLPPTLHYQEYLHWLHRQDDVAAEKFWSGILSDFDQPSVFDVATAGALTRDVHRKSFGRELSARLSEFSRRNKVTLSNVMQGAWAVLLSRYSGHADVVFGAVTSGRNANLPNMQAAVGLFINTLPVRVKLTAQTTVRELAGGLQEYNLALQPFEHLPLARIQRASGVAPGRQLFESLIVFENYPVAAEVSRGASWLRIEEVRVMEGTHFPLTILVGPGDEMDITLQYDRSRFGEMIGTLTGDFQHILEFFCRDADRLVSEFTAARTMNIATHPVALSAPDGSVEHVGPRNRMEILLVKLWQSVLKCDRIGVFENFFSLGGDSIRSIQFKALARRNGIDFELQDLFECPTIAELAGRIRPLDSAGPDLACRFDLVAREDRDRMAEGIEDAYPLTAMQSGMLYHSGFAADSTAYLFTFSFELEGRLSLDVFTLALRELLSRHAALRTSFDVAAYSTPLQLVHTVVGLPFESHDLSALPPERQDAMIAAWIAETPAQSLRWNEAPMLRFCVHLRSGDRFHLGFCMHHAILDGWSLTVMMRELLLLYESHLGGDPLPEPPANVFREFVKLESECIKSAAARTFWRKKVQSFAGAGSVGGRVVHDGEPKRVEATVGLGGELAAKLNAIAAKLGVPLKSVLLAAHGRVLHSLTGAERVVTGCVVDGRPELPDADRSVGLFLNTVPISLSTATGNWADLIRAAYDAETELLPHRRFPLSEIQRLNDGTPLFHTAFNFANFHLYREIITSGVFRVLQHRLRAELTFDLFADFNISSDQSIQLTLQAGGSAFSPKRFDAVLDCYTWVLEQITADPFGPLAQAPPLRPGLRRRLLAANVEAPIEFPRDRLVHHFIEEQVKRAPERIAVESAVETLTYQELNHRANAIAARLSERGVGPESLVAVALPRTPSLVAALLGIWKAGGAYVPIDPAYPPERISTLLRAARPRFLLTAPPSVPDALQFGTSILRLEELLCGSPEFHAADPSDPHRLAYVIYTSGSTGTPKGVAIEHSSVVAFLQWAVRHFPAERLSSVLAATSVCFDLSVFELFAPLMCGGRVVIVDNALQLIGADLRDIGLLNTVPSVMRELLNAGAVPQSVRTVNLAGEALPAQIANDVLRLGHVRDFYNLYGPSEDTTYSTVCRIDGPQTSAPSIGRSIAGTQLYLLNPALEPVVEGGVGEIYLCGEGLARGYLGQPALTASGFIPDPFSMRPGARLYRTGDLARYRDDGALEFCGRQDDQVKVRGFRVEPAEIEAHLGAHPAVSEVAVVLGEVAQGKQLVAFYRPAQADVGSEELRRYLSNRLPEHMVPSAFAPIDRLPRTPNGKVDRKQLQAIRVAHRNVPKPRTPPSGDIETALAAIWSDVLGITDAGAEDSFYDLGGDSLLSVRVCAKAQASGMAITPRDIHTNRTIRELALKIRSKGGTSRRLPSEDRVPLTPSQKFFFVGQPANPNHFNLSGLLRVEHGLSPDEWRNTIQALLDTHDALRLRFTPGENGWSACIAASGEPPPFDSVDLRHRTAEAPVLIHGEAARQQTALSIDRGPLCRFTFFDTGDPESSRLLFVIHHLAADGHSLLTLLDDLQTAVSQVKSGRPVKLPPVDTTWQEWSNWLAFRADSPKLLSDLDYWMEHSRPCEQIPKDFDHAEDLLGETEEITWTLDETRTTRLRASAVAGNADLSHLLVTALSQAVAGWIGSDAVRLDVIGHGRNYEMAPEVSRTVGYFAARYPLRIASLGHGGDALDSVRRAMSSVPGGGVGWGVLRYMSDPRVARALAGYINPEISFNYSSRQGWRNSGGRSISLADEAVGITQDPKSRRACKLRLFANLQDDCVSTRWQFNSRLHRRSTIESVVARFSAHLDQLADSGRLAQASVS